jgi:hypothetical protein
MDAETKVAGKSCDKSDSGSGSLATADVQLLMKSVLSI